MADGARLTSFLKIGDYNYSFDAASVGGIAPSNLVTLNGAQTISGIKSFTGETKFTNAEYAPNFFDIAGGIGKSSCFTRGAFMQAIVGEFLAPNGEYSDADTAMDIQKDTFLFWKMPGIISTGQPSKTLLAKITDEGIYEGADLLKNKYALKNHGTHVSFSTTLPKVDSGSGSVGTATTVARSDHAHPTDTTRAAASDLTGHITNRDIHVTTTDRNNWNEKISNAFVTVTVGEESVTATGKDTFTVSSGTGIKVALATDSKQLGISNTGVRSISSGTTQGAISVNTGGKVASVAVYGLGNAAYQDSSAFDLSGVASIEATSAKNSAVSEAKEYTDEQISKLVGGTLSDTNLDTITEIVNTLKQNKVDDLATKESLKNYVPLKGNSSIDGTLVVSNLGAGYVEATWLKASSTTELQNGVRENENYLSDYTIPVFRRDHWIYYRTQENFKNDLGINHSLLALNESGGSPNGAYLEMVPYKISDGVPASYQLVYGTTKVPIYISNAIHADSATKATTADSATTATYAPNYLPLTGGDVKGDVSAYSLKVKTVSGDSGCKLQYDSTNKCLDFVFS